MYMFCSLEMHIPRNIFPGSELSELDAIGEESKGCLRTSSSFPFYIVCTGTVALVVSSKSSC